MPRPTTTRKACSLEPLILHGPPWPMKTCTRRQTKSLRRSTFAAHQHESNLRSRGRILIVDHDQTQGEQLSHCLRDLSYSTVTTTNLAQARNAVLTEGPFKAVVCDFMLPDGNGLEFLTWLRRKRRNHTRFLLINFPGRTPGKERALNGQNPVG